MRGKFENIHSRPINSFQCATPRLYVKCSARSQLNHIRQ